MRTDDYKLDDPALLERTRRNCRASGVSLAITEPRIITQLGRSLLGEVGGRPRKSRRTQAAA